MGGHNVEKKLSYLSTVPGNLLAEFLPETLEEISNFVNPSLNRGSPARRFEQT